MNETLGRVIGKESLSGLNAAESLGLIVLSHNEEKHILRLMANWRAIGGPVFVVDSYSSDRTIEFAQRSGAVVVQRKFVNQSEQMEWAIENFPFRTDWVMRLDADELLSQELIEEIRSRLREVPEGVSGIVLRRRHMFMGRWIRYGGRYPVRLLRIWRNGSARVERRWMDEHIVLLEGRSVEFRRDFIDENLNDLSHFVDKHNKYATREAIDVLAKRYQGENEHQKLTSENVGRHIARRRLLKEKLYNRLPLWVGPSAYFFYRYLILGGFLDGRAGLIYHFLQGFWYRFLVASKIAELEDRLSRSEDERRKFRAMAASMDCLPENMLKQRSVGEA